MSDGTGAAEAGLAWLLGGGVADAMAAIEGTLATVQNAATQAFAGLSRVQAAGAAMAAVPPVAHAAAEPAEIATGTASERPAQRVTAPMVSVSSEAARVAAFAPSVASGGGPVAPTAPAEAPPLGKDVVSVTFAAFAPAAPPVPTGQAMMATAEAPRAAAALGQAAMEAMPAAAPMPGAGAAVAPPRAYAPAANSRTEGGPTGGDVFLDGARVGTWLADHLAREAGKPQTGATGFDPRMSPAWPGTLQGG